MGEMIDFASNGGTLDANYRIPNTVMRDQFLGRLPAGGTANGNTTISLLTPSMLYPLERRTQLDMRFAKILRFGKYRTSVNLDLANAFNSSGVTAINNNYAAWQVPTGIHLARIAKISAQFDF